MMRFSLHVMINDRAADSRGRGQAGGVGGARPEGAGLETTLRKYKPAVIPSGVKLVIHSFFFFFFFWSLLIKGQTVASFLRACVCVRLCVR